MIPLVERYLGFGGRVGGQLSGRLLLLMLWLDGTGAETVTADLEVS